MKYQINIFIFLTLLLISCGNKTQVADTGSSVMSENEVNMTDAQLNNASLESGKLIKQVLHTQIKLNGTVDIPPQNIVSVSFPMGGYLKTTSLIPGMNIRKGAVIATIEDHWFNCNRII